MRVIDDLTADYLHNNNWLEEGDHSDLPFAREQHYPPNWERGTNVHKMKKIADGQSSYSPSISSPASYSSPAVGSSNMMGGEGGGEENYFLSVALGTGCLVAVVLLAAVFLRCYNQWRSTRYHRQLDDEESSSTKTNIRISHSLPDLSCDLAKQEYVQEVKEKKLSKVLRQTTLPTVPSRLQTFHRQLSQRLEASSQQKQNETMDFAKKTLQRTASNKRKPMEDTIGLIQPELYKQDLTRQSSGDSSTTETEKVGSLHFSLRFDPELEVLVVKVIQATELPVKDMCGSSDPYIKIYLLPDRKKKHQTKVHRRNLNPEFNETFLFSVSHDDLQDRYLQFSVYDFDRFSRHDLIGHVLLKGLLDLSDLSSEIDYTMDILAPPKDKQDLGELMVSLCYLPTAGRLTVTVIKARNLRAMDITGSSDPYCKVYLMCQGKKLRKRKTTVKKSCLCPVWNESVVFDVPSELVQEVQLFFKVADYDRVGSNEQLGVAASGALCIGPGRDHWLEMLDNPRRPVAQWYPLQESMLPNAGGLGGVGSMGVLGTDAGSPPDSPFITEKGAGMSPAYNKQRHYSLGCMSTGKFFK